MLKKTLRKHNKLDGLLDKIEKQTEDLQQTLQKKDCQVVMDGIFCKKPPTVAHKHWH